MRIKFREKCFKKLYFFAIIVITGIGILETASGSSAEAKVLTKRRANDYDEHFGFGLMNDDISGRHHQVLERGDSDFKNIDEDLIIDTSEEVWDGGGGSDASKSIDVAKPLSFPPDSDGIVYVGCFNSWIQNKMSYPDRNFSQNHTYKTCTKYCHKYQLSLLKGGQCICSHIDNFELIKMGDEKCNVPCPVSTITTSYDSTVDPSKACGGNYFFSVYCQTNENAKQDCTSIKTRSAKPEAAYNGKVSKFEEPFIECASCSNICTLNYLTPAYDYFPKNDPASCIKFCKVEVHYMWSLLNEVRMPTKYAVLTWKEDLALGHVLPICRCVEDLSNYMISSNRCETPCPGDPTASCGNFNAKSAVYSTVYCTSDPCVTEGPTDNTSTTTDNLRSTHDGCDEICTEDPSPETKNTDNTESTIPITHWTDPFTVTDNHSDPPTTQVTPEVTSKRPTSKATTTNPTTSQVTTSVVTTSTPSATMPPNEIGCHVMCRGTERNGRYWEACAGAVEEQECRHTNVTGKVTWKCMDNGQFETQQPDYSDCHSPWVGDLGDQASKINDTTSALKFLTNLKTVISEMSESVETTYFGHEIQSVATILIQVVKKAGNVTESAGKFEEIAEKAVDVSQYLITTQEPWFEISHVERSKVSTELINTIEDTSILLTSKVNLSSGITSYQNNLSPPIPGYLVSAGAISKSQEGESDAKSLEFPMNRSSKESFIRLPADWMDLIQEEKIEFVGISIDPKYVNVMMPGQFKSLGVDPSDRQNKAGQKLKLINSQLMSFTLASAKTSRYINVTNRLGKTMVGDDNKISIRFRDSGVQITFEHDLEAWGDDAVDIRRKLHPGESRKAALGTSQCVYWDPKTSTWSTEGCKLVSSNRFQTVCQCSHLTSFAILMDAHNYVGKELGLEILTLILCSLSFICLFISITIFSTIRGVQNMRTTITKNLSICLLVGNTLVLLVLDRHYMNMSDGVCIASGIVSHYVFLSAFIWMAIEGLHLYKMVVHVFDTEKNPLNMYRGFSYGLPLIIVAVTVVIGYLKGDRPYGGDAVCWLDGAYIWSFMVPVALVVLVNFIILFIALKTAYQLQHNTHMPILLQSRVRSFRTWIRGCFSITVLLGLTWLVGFFTLIPAAPGVAAAYIFTILNASQGIFIFVYHCILNDKVRFMTSKRFGSYLPSWLSSSVNNNSSASQANEASGFGQRAVSNMKSSNSNPDFFKNEKPVANIAEKTDGNIRAKYNLHPPLKNVVSMDQTGGGVDGSISVITPISTRFRRTNLMRRRESLGTVSSVESLRPTNYSSGSISDSGSNTDNSSRDLITIKHSNSGI